MLEHELISHLPPHGLNLLVFDLVEGHVADLYEHTGVLYEQRDLLKELHDGLHAV